MSTPEQPPNPEPQFAQPKATARSAVSLPGLASSSLGTLQTAVGFALGVAASGALEPVGTGIRQTAFGLEPNRALDLADIATIVAQALQKQAWGEGEAKNTGVNASRFDLVYQTQLVAPPLGTLIELLNRGEIKQADFTHGLRKGQYEPQWDSPLQLLAQARLDPAVIALGIVRGLIPNEGILPVAPPTAAGKVPAFPVFPIDALKEAQAHGVDKTRLSVMVGNMGRPASPQEALAAYWRGAIDHVDYWRAIAEGDIRNEWRDAIEAASRQILTADQYAELELRGFIDQATRRQLTAKHGMSQADSDLLFNVLGRAPAVHTITKGLAYGGKFNGPTSTIPPVYLSAIQRGNLRPEYYDIAYHDRYLWPSAFVLRAMVQGGELSQQDGENILLYQGWEPTLADKVSKVWAKGTGTAGDKHVGKAETSVWSALHKSYVNNLSTDAEAQADLAKIGVTSAAIPQVLSLWKVEQDIVRRSLTPADLKKAVEGKLLTAQQATQRLIDLGYSPTDAADKLSL